MKTDGATVLVVAGTPAASQCLADGLAATGRLRVVSASDASRAVQYVHRLRPDLVVIDDSVPALGGTELVRAIGETPGRIAIIVVTAEANEELRAALHRRSVQDFLVKPFSIEELSVRVDQVIERARAARERATSSGQDARITEAASAVSEAIGAIAATSVEAVLKTIALKAQTLTGADYVAVGIGTDPDRPFDWWVTVGLSPDREAMIGYRPRPVGLLGTTGDGRPLRVRDLRDHPAYRGFPPHHPAMASFLRVSIRYRGRTVGQLFLAKSPGADQFTAQHVHVVEMLCARAGTAIETALLYRSEGMERVWLQAVVDQMPEGVVLMDAAGRAMTHNRAILALSDGSTERDPSAIGLDLWRLDGHRVPPEDLPSTRVLTDGHAVLGVELLARRSDGALIPVSVSAAPVHATDGTVAGATMIVRDISANKEIERMREEWAAIVAHELAQPINAILLGAELMLRGSLDDRQRDTLQRIRSSAMHMTRLSRDLMDASQLETRRMKLQSSSVDLCALVREVVASSSDDERVALEAPAGSLVVRCDPDRIRQVVQNLLSNAAKYGEPATEIEVSVAAAGSFAQIDVTSHGRAIDPDELETLFDRYVRSRHARNSAIPGSGLGLYIVNGLVEAHGGRIWATSLQSDTTVFHVLLPLDSLPPHRPEDATPGEG